ALCASLASQNPRTRPRPDRRTRQHRRRPREEKRTAAGRREVAPARTGSSRRRAESGRCSDADGSSVWAQRNSAARGRSPQPAVPACDRRPLCASEVSHVLSILSLKVTSMSNEIPAYTYSKAVENYIVEGGTVNNLA